MADVSGIDRVFDFIDKGVDAADRVLNRSKYTEDQHKARRDQQGPEEMASSAPISSSKALATRRFRLIEALDSDTGRAIFIVTDGGAARCECNSRETAQKILLALETAP